MTTVRVAIRLESGLDVGYGHAVRCSVLADAFSAAGCEVVFICFARLDSFFNLTSERRHRVIWMDSGIRGTSEILKGQDDSQICCATLQGVNFLPDIVVVDHYGLDFEWELNVKSWAGTVVALEDYPDRSHAADILIAYSRDHVRQPFNSRAAPTILLEGVEHLLVRSEYLGEKPKPLSATIPRLLVFFGSGDPTRETERLISCLTQQSGGGAISACPIHFVIGSCNARYNVIREALTALPNCRLSIQLPSLLQAMNDADIVLSAGGNSMIEAVTLGKPTIVVTTSRNQVDLCREWSARRFVVYVGHYDRIVMSDIEHAIHDMPIVFNERILPALLDQPIDGRGPMRIVGVILSLVGARPRS